MFDKKIQKYTMKLRYAKSLDHAHKYQEKLKKYRGSMKGGRKGPINLDNIADIINESKVIIAISKLTDILIRDLVDNRTDIQMYLSQVNDLEFEIINDTFEVNGKVLDMLDTHVANDGFYEDFESQISNYIINLSKRIIKNLNITEETNLIIRKLNFFLANISGKFIDIDDSFKVKQVIDRSTQNYTTELQNMIDKLIEKNLIENIKRKE
jgi:hypothetical protein